MIKKIAFSLLCLLVLASVSMSADAPKKTVTVSAPAAPAAAPAQKNMALGVYAGSPTIAYKFTPSFLGEAGILYNSSSNNTNNWTLMLHGDQDLTSGPVSTHAGGTLWLTSASAAGATTTTYVIGALWGITGWLADNFSVTADLYPLIFTSATAGGASTTTFSLLSYGTIGGRFWF